MASRLNKSFTICLAIILTLPSCYSSKKDGENIFRYNEFSGIASLDPAFAKNQSVMWPIHQLFNTLVEVNEKLEIVPSLATRFTVSEDRRTYVFHLRKDVLFHDDPCFPGGKGRRLTAHDVAYSFQRIMDKETASTGAWIFNEKVDSTEPFKALDDTSFQLKLARPYHPILGILSMQYCSIVPHEAVKKYGADFRRHPVGSGPFQFVAWEEGQALIMKKHPGYFERDSAGNQLPYLDGIHISFYDSKATEFLLLRQGKLDFTNDIDASFKDEVLNKKGALRKEWEGKLLLQTHPYLNIEYLGILIDSTNELVRDSPMKLRKVRQAINYGFDRRKMILYLRNSLAIPAESGFVPAGLPSFDTSQVKGYTYDPKKARQLMTEAGYNGKDPVKLHLLTINIYTDIAEFIAKQLEDIGFIVQVETVQKSLLLELTSTSRAPFFRGSWIADYPDAENYLSVFYSRNPAPPNYTRYRNPEFDAVFEKALAETNDSLRYGLYQKADAIMISDAPVVPLWYDVVVHLVQPWVKNFRPNALNLLELRRVKLDKRSILQSKYGFAAPSKAQTQ
jgi:peptide/nickel transport system substrate-binding protein